VDYEKKQKGVPFYETPCSWSNAGLIQTGMTSWLN